MGTPRGVLPLPSTPQAAGLARDHVRALGAAWSPQGLETVLLAVSEAVTNAVRYGRGDIGLDVRVDDGVVRIEVSDANPEVPHRRPRSGDGLAEGGLGLHLLDAITQDWGTSARPDGAGKTVWMELRPPPAGA